MKLFNYQIDGAHWLAEHRFALLADEMGVGKTAQAITAADIVSAERILIICPAVARSNWIREFEKFSTRSRTMVTVTTQKQALMLRESAVVSYDLALSNSNNLKGPWDLLILDEAHYLKNPEAKRTKVILGREGLIRHAERVWALTGTPMPNHPAELWPLLYTFGRTTLPYAKFIDNFCTWADAGHHGRQITGAKAERIPELRSALEPVMLRRRKEDVLKDLPSIYYNDIFVDPGPVDEEIEFVSYFFPQDRISELRKILSDERELVTNVLDKADTLTAGIEAAKALANSVSTLRRYTGLQKVQPAAELLQEELSNRAYDKIVVFAHHRGVIEGLRSKLTDFRPLTLYGGTPSERVQENIDKFQNDSRYRVLIANIEAAGTSITLTAAHNVLFVEQDWTPGNNAQAAMRVHRLGQTKPVYVRFMSIADSIDSRISQVLKRKTRDITEVFDDAKNSKSETVKKQLQCENEIDTDFEKLIS
jgi:SWI/SNF-related matrix-associated actin-dependent regulator of chromatin subfamily A-like protein 1